MFQLHQQHGGLNRRHTAGHPHFLVIVSGVRAVRSQAAGARGDFVVVGEQHASVAGGVQIFGGIKTQDRRDAEASGRLSVACGEHGLRRVFHDNSAGTGETLHVRDLSE